jgi:hypothetical protein
LCHESLEFTEITAELRSVQAMKPNASCRFQFFATSKANYEKPIICGFKSGVFNFRQHRLLKTSRQHRKHVRVLNMDLGLVMFAITLLVFLVAK